MKNISLYCFLCLATFFLCSGCGGAAKPKDLPDLYPSKITITQGGSPLEGASVTLVSDQKIRFTVGGKTDAQGVCQIITDGQWPGAPSGTYKVLVKKAVTPEITADASDHAAYQKALEENSKKSRHVVDLKYSSVKTTPESVEVTATGLDSTIDVGDAVDIPTSTAK